MAVCVADMSNVLLFEIVGRLV